MKAGKADMTFQTRAPSSTALEKMLATMSSPVGHAHQQVRRDQPANERAARAVRPYHSSLPRHQHRDARIDHRYVAAAGGDVSDDDVRPVKVKVECPPRADTVFSFRVQSNAA